MVSSTWQNLRSHGKRICDGTELRKYLEPKNGWQQYVQDGVINCCFYFLI